MTKKELLKKLCLGRMKKLGILDAAHLARLKNELIEIEVQDQYEYFLGHCKSGTRWEHNDHNLLVPYLLNLCPEFDITKETAFTMGEFPDIDVDYLAVVREYLMNEWAPKKFGADKVCHIGTYSTYNLKQSLIDMARIFGESRTEVMNVTTQFGAKDDEGDALTWEKALTIYPSFREYVKNHPDVADAAKKICGRNRNMGQHAGGFIVSRTPLTGFVPLVRNKKDNQLMTAWPEGQSAQELQAVGLVKLDLLSSKMSTQIKDCIGLIRQRHGEVKISAREGGSNWSDHSYLDDPKCMEMANKGDLRFIFQFDSDGIRRLVRTGGVDGFQDLEAYSALYRPGTLSMGMHDVYCNRKKGKEVFDIHPVLEPYLQKTYGVAVFQESVMKVLNKAGGIPLRDCMAVIKAISKKKIEKFAKYKELFIRNSQRILGIKKEAAGQFWEQIEAFAGYGFNKAHSCVYTHVSARQLYLKCYYPLEYYCSYLNHIKGADAKMRDCVRDAARHNVTVNSIDINKSEEHFQIADDDEIYFGFANVKHVGEKVATRLVEERRNGPFTDFQNFLDRFGTDAKIIQALVSLGAFEGDPVCLYEYYEYYKDYHTKQTQRRKRYEVALKRYEDQFHEFAGHNFAFGTEEQITFAIDNIDDEEAKAKLRRLRGNYRRTLTNNTNNERNDTGPVSFENFVSPKKSAIKEDLRKILQDKAVAEIEYYGFTWSSPLESCPNLEGDTFAEYRSARLALGPVEGAIQDVREVKSRKGNKYYVVQLLDANWELGFVNVWTADMAEFTDKLKPGNIVRMRLQAPNPKFASERYSLESYPRKRRGITREQSNARVMILRSPDQEVKVVTNEPPITLDKEREKKLEVKEDVETAELYQDLDKLLGL